MRNWGKGSWELEKFRAGARVRRAQRRPGGQQTLWYVNRHALYLAICPKFSFEPHPTGLGYTVGDCSKHSSGSGMAGTGSKLSNSVSVEYEARAFTLAVTGVGKGWLVGDRTRCHC